MPLVKPDATTEEVSAVVQGDQGAGGQIFAQAVRRPTSSISFFFPLSECGSLHLPRVMESLVLHIARFKNGMKISEGLTVR